MKVLLRNRNQPVDQLLPCYSHVLLTLNTKPFLCLPPSETNISAFKNLNSIQPKIRQSLSSIVSTRSQVNRESRSEQTGDRFTNVDDNISVADHYSGSYFNENDEETLRSLEKNHERFRIEHSFLLMNKQIGELTSTARAFTEKMTNNREKDDQNGHNFGRALRSDNNKCHFPENNIKCRLITFVA